ncbi:hypothetical protein B7463_g1885, partial [Scytalidium lignicola]
MEHYPESCLLSRPSPQCQDQEEACLYNSALLNWRPDDSDNSIQQSVRQVSGLGMSTVECPFQSQGFEYFNSFIYPQCIFRSQSFEPVTLQDAFSPESFETATTIDSQGNIHLQTIADLISSGKHNGANNLILFKEIESPASSDIQSFPDDSHSFPGSLGNSSPPAISQLGMEQAFIPTINQFFLSECEDFMNCQHFSTGELKAFTKNRQSAVQYQSVTHSQHIPNNMQEGSTGNSQSSAQYQISQHVRPLPSENSEISKKHFQVSIKETPAYPKAFISSRIYSETPYTYHYGKSRRQKRITQKICAKVCPKCNMLSWCASFQKHLQRVHNLSQKESKILFKATPLTKIANPDWKTTRHSGDNSIRAMRKCAICNELIFEHIFLIHLQRVHSGLRSFQEMVEVYESSSVMQIRERLYYKQKYERKGKAIFLNGLKRCLACYDIVDDRDFDTHKKRRHPSLSAVQGGIVKIDLPLRARLDDVIKIVPCSKCHQVLLKNYDYHLRDAHSLPAALAHKIVRSAKSFTIRRTARIDDDIIENPVDGLTLDF